MSKFHLQIVTPDNLFLDEEVESITVRTSEGELTILKDHIDFVSTLKIHVASVKQNGKSRKAAVAGGIIQNDKDKVTIISAAAEWSDRIDVQRAERAKAESERKMKILKENEKELRIAEYRLKKAINRINASR